MAFWPLLNAGQNFWNRYGTNFQNRILDCVARAGGKPQDVVRTRMFVTDISKWQEIGRAHGEVFGEIRPVTTMVEVKALISSEYLVEIEATAVVE